MKITPAAVGVSVTGYVPREARDYQPEVGSSMVQALAVQVDQMAPIILEFDEKMRALEGDLRLSKLGRDEKVLALFQQYRGRLGITELDKRAELGQKELDRLQQIADLPSMDDAHALQLASDIRSHVRALGNSERTTFLAEHSSDRQVLSALLSAPPYLSGMSEVELNRFRRTALDRLHPERATRIALLEATISGAQRARANAERMLSTRARIRFDERTETWVAAGTSPFGSSAR